MQKSGRLGGKFQRTYYGRKTPTIEDVDYIRRKVMDMPEKWKLSAIKFCDK